jgi:hypothetical protein
MPAKTADSFETDFLEDDTFDIERPISESLLTADDTPETRRFSSMAAALRYSHASSEELDRSLTSDISSDEFLTPSQFAAQKLGVDCWPKMQEIFDAVERGERKILVRSCNGAGKTTALAALCNWKLSQFPDSIVLTTASSWVQVKRSLWGEIRRQARYASLYRQNDVASTEIKLDDKHYAIGISPSMAENAQGFHAPNMLIAVDEATGVRRDIIDALWGNATGKDAQMILIYNPIDDQSFPFTAEENGTWHVITISAFEHPNVITGTEQIAGAVTREWIEDRMENWSYETTKPKDVELIEGEVPEWNASPSHVYLHWCDKWYKKTELVATRVCGEWPMEGGESYIERSLVHATFEVPAVQGVRAIGVDVARSGNDRTVFAFFDGNLQLPFETYQGRNLMATANRIVELYKEGWKVIALDDTGIGGGVSDRLRELNIPHSPVNFAARPKGYIRTKQLANARAEMYFLLEEEIRRGEVKLLNDKEMVQELTGFRIVVEQSSGAYRIEDKDAIRQRLGRSPDKSDAVALARYGIRLDWLNNRPKFM